MKFHLIEAHVDGFFYNNIYDKVYVHKSHSNDDSRKQMYIIRLNNEGKKEAVILNRNAKLIRLDASSYRNSNGNKLCTPYCGPVSVLL